MSQAGPRVLYLCSRLPAQVQGGLDVRVREQLAVLAANWPTAVFALTGSEELLQDELVLARAGSDPAPAQMATAADLALALANSESPYAMRYSAITDGELRDTIATFGPDVIILSRLELSPYIDTLRASGARLVLDLDEAASRVVTSIASIEDNPGKALFARHYGAALRRLEAEMVDRFDVIWMSSTVERGLLLSAYPHLPPPHIVPNTVDTDHIPFTLADRQRDLIVYPASFHYPPNIDAAHFLIDELMPLLPAHRLALVGSVIPDWMRAIADPRISAYGPVRDMRPEFASAGVVPIPIRAGGGTRLKALEALAAGAPIVSTEYGVDGIAVSDRVHYLRAETAPEFADAIRSLAADDALREALATRGRELVEAQYSRAALLAALRVALSDPT